MKTRIYSSPLMILLLNLCVSATYAQDDKLYNHVSLKTPPTYPGGMQKFYEFINTNLIYPKTAAENKVQGTVNVNFNIETDGTINDLKAEGRKIGSGIEEEALRVMKLSRRWSPGMVNGKPVRVKYNIPIKFAMKK